MTVHALHPNVPQATPRSGPLAAVGALGAAVAARLAGLGREAIALHRAQQTRRAAAELRRRAQQVRASNPGLADDLDMAVDRMERDQAGR